MNRRSQRARIQAGGRGPARGTAVAVAQGMTTNQLKPGDVVDVFVIRGRRAGRLVGYLCKGTAVWNGTTGLLPYSRSPDLGGFVVRTETLVADGAKFAGKSVYTYTRQVRS